MPRNGPLGQQMLARAAARVSLGRVLPTPAKPVIAIGCKGPPLQTLQCTAVALSQISKGPFSRGFRGGSGLGVLGRGGLEKLLLAPKFSRGGLTNPYKPRS